MSRRAKLTSDLLVRKGQAIPTGGFAHAGLDLSQPLPVPARLEAPRADRLLVTTTLGAGATRLTPAERGRTATGCGRLALTLRLDRERHRRLKVFCARGRQTAQEVLIQALDAYLEACGADCACLRGEPQGCARN